MIKYDITDKESCIFTLSEMTGIETIKWRQLIEYDTTSYNDLGQNLWEFLMRYIGR